MSSTSNVLPRCELPKRAAGDSHSDELKLLKQAAPEANYSTLLRRLIDSKSETQYSASLITEARAAGLSAARKLLDGADEVLRSLP
jgi:hypothetical protein